MKKNITNVYFKFCEYTDIFEDIWSKRKEHHKDAEWLKEVKKELEQDQGQDKISKVLGMGMLMIGMKELVV